MASMFVSWADSLRKEFDENRAAPPLKLTEPKYGGSAFWAWSMQKALERNWRSLKVAVLGDAADVDASAPPGPEGPPKPNGLLAQTSDFEEAQVVYARLHGILGDFMDAR